MTEEEGLVSTEAVSNDLVTKNRDKYLHDRLYFLEDLLCLLFLVQQFKDTFLIDSINSIVSASGYLKEVIMEEGLMSTNPTVIRKACTFSKETYFLKYGIVVCVCCVWKCVNVI